VLSFISFPFICRILGDQYLGIYTWANTFVYYFLIIAKISIPNIAVRECVKVRDNKEELAKKVKLFFCIQAVTTILSFIMLFVLVYAIPSLHESRYGVDMSTLIFLLSINFLSGVFSFEWVYIALEKHFYMAIRSIFVLALSTIFIFIFVKYPEQVYVYAFFTVGVTVLTVIINSILLPKYIKFKGTGIAPLKPYIKPLLLLFVISLVLTLYNQSDTFLLGLMDQSKKEVGSYSVAMKGVEIIITIITSLGAVFMPRASDYFEKKETEKFSKLTKYSMNICFFIAIPAIATMATMSDAITGLISGSAVGNDANQYADAWIILSILVSMTLTYSIGDIIYQQILIPIKQEKIYLYTMLIGTVLDISLSILFGLVIFKDQPGIGVAIATISSDILIVAYLLIKTKNYSKKAVFNLNNLKILFAGILVAVFTIFIGPLLMKTFLNNGQNYMTSYLFELIIMVAMDAIIYIVTLLLLKENLVSTIFHLKNKEEV
jgi:O-antigen/teichoic acid export membrane protein